MASELTNSTVPAVASHTCNPAWVSAPAAIERIEEAKSPEDIQLPPSPPLPLERNQQRMPPSPRWLLPTERPSTPRRATSPESIPTITTNINSMFSASSIRPRSPAARHLRSNSSSSTMSLPLMQRAHSSPGVDSTGRYLPPPPSAPRRPSSPLERSGRRRSPMRSALDDPNLSVNTPTWSEPTIPEHAELLDFDISPSFNTFPRSRRRPHSPLHPSASAPSLHLHARATSPFASGNTSPSLAAQRYANEPYPGYSFSSASSMPSTPTSLRSRSPSISSLETIEDTPEAEEEAEESANDEKMAADVEMRRRSSLDVRGGGLRSNKERKRWSVCGAERRADFSLEPIEE